MAPGSLKSFVCVANEGQVQLGLVLLAQGLNSSTVRTRVITLINFIDREIRAINIGLEVRPEGCCDITKLVPVHTLEEGVSFDFQAAVLTGRCAQTIKIIT